MELSSRETKTSALARLLCNYFKINANISTVKSEIYVRTVGFANAILSENFFVVRCSYLALVITNMYKRFGKKERGTGE